MELNSHLGRAKNNVTAILELSYQNLSPQLKSCFLYLAFFKEDATISVKRLINIMIGQGLIQKTGRTTTDETTRGYLDELISRNMVQVKDLTLDNRVKNCQLHDSIRKMCLEKAQEEIGLKNLIWDRMISLHKPRHRIMACTDLESFPMDQNKHIRSLFLLNVNFRDIKSTNFKFFQNLKILDLEVNYPFQRLPDSFRLLLGLKQLRILTKYNCFIRLPTWLNMLKELETLDMGALDVKFPNVALKMDSLRHIHANRVHALKITSSWKNVETLKYIRQYDWIWRSSRPTDVYHVRELGLVLDQELRGVRASLEKLENLVKLHLVWQYYHPMEDSVIPRLRSITKLKLSGVMRRAPSASMLPPNLSHLTLEMSLLRIDPMPELSRLPKLLYLKLKKDSYLGETMRVPRGGFPNLRGLSLQRLHKLLDLEVNWGGMAQLKLLRVDHCPTLHTYKQNNKSYQLQVVKNNM